jgi:50S ribosomal protein L16 3-hydroxylase
MIIGPSWHRLSALSALRPGTAPGRHRRRENVDMSSIDTEAPAALLGGLSPATFMRRHWQKKPLLVRQAWPGVVPPLTRAALFALAGQEDVESRVVERRDVVAASRARGATPDAAAWRVRHGPFARRALPPASRPGWTLLVQGLDLHVPAARALLDAFRFVPEARLDDLMLSWASDGGGVGPHLDAYDVFLLQVAGRRRWRIGRPRRDAAFVPGAPLKLLAAFEPEHEWVLEPGDLLYLPPGWGHDGDAMGGDCMTASVGFRAPSERELAGELLARLADEVAESVADERAAGAAPGGRRYRDPQQPATATPAALPLALRQFAGEALNQALQEDPYALARILGEWLSEPKPQVWFEAGVAQPGAVKLADRSRMLYDERHVFINGQAYEARGRDARLMQRLADTRRLDAASRSRLSAGAAALLGQWLAAGWLQMAEAGEAT